MSKLSRAPVQRQLLQLVPVPVEQLLVEQGREESVQTTFVIHAIN